MRDRIDALGGQGTRRHLFPAALLDTSQDAALQALLEDAARATDAPIALVSLILDRVQLFRAHRGLPPDLAAAGATDRDVSFCQFVVEDEEMLAVEDAANEPRVPQTLVASHNVRAYLGAPIRVRGDVLGSLCVIHGEPRRFTTAERDALRALASRVSARLEALAAESLQQRQALQAAAAQPAFGELRNQLMVIVGSLDDALYQHAQLAPLARLQEDPAWAPSARLLRSASGAVDTLGAALVDADAAAAGAARTIDGLGALLDVTEGGSDLQRVLERADTAAHHITKLVGGVQGPGGAARSRLSAPSAAATAALSTVLTGIAERLFRRPGATGPIELAADIGLDAVALRASATELTAADVTSLVAALSPQLDGQPGLRLAADGDRVLLVLERTW